LPSTNEYIVREFRIIGRLISYYAAPRGTFAADDIIVSRRYSVSKAEVNGIFLICGERVFTSISGSDRVVVLNGDIATIVPALKLLTAGEWSERIQQKVPDNPHVGGRLYLDVAFIEGYYVALDQKTGCP
jgi:hypothetical protein